MWSTVGVDRNALQNTAPEILDLSDHRSSQKARFGGEFLPSVTEVASGQLADQLARSMGRRPAMRANPGL